jgi:hypothetical protein
MVRCQLCPPKAPLLKEKSFARHLRQAQQSTRAEAKMLKARALKQARNDYGPVVPCRVPRCNAKVRRARVPSHIYWKHPRSKLNPRNTPSSDAFRKGGDGKQYPERIGEFPT